jgi:hypothetical protein
VVVPRNLLGNRLIGAFRNSAAGQQWHNKHFKFMLRLERLWEQQNRTPVLLISGAIILAIALLDWWTKPYVSLGFFYLFPIMLAAGFLPRWMVVLLGVVCAVLSEVFSSLDNIFKAIPGERRKSFCFEGLKYGAVAKKFGHLDE